MGVSPYFVDMPAPIVPGDDPIPDAEHYPLLSVAGIQNAHWRIPLAVEHIAKIL